MGHSHPTSALGGGAVGGDKGSLAPDERPCGASHTREGGHRNNERRVWTN